MEALFTQIRDGAWTPIAVAVGLRLVGVLLILLIGVRVARWLARLVEQALTRARVEVTTAMFLRKIAYVILLVVLILTALQVVGVSMTPVVAILGAAGLAIGLALKDSLSNIASGVMLVMLKPFRVGDMVEIANETGKVEAISIFQTRLRGADNQVITLPNSLVTTDSIINLTPDTMRRIELIIGIGYSNNIDVARSAALEVMHADDRILSDPAPSVLVYTLGDNCVNLGIRSHVANSDYFVTKCELTEKIKKAFDDAAISIPFPQRDVHMFHHAVAEDGSARDFSPSPQLLPAEVSQPAPAEQR